MLRALPKPLDLWTDEEFIKMHGEAARTDRRNRPVYLGDLERPGWTGRIPTYLVWCRFCQYGESEGFTVAHEAGYSRRLECRTCRRRYEHRLAARRLEAALRFHRHPAFPGTLAIVILAAALLALALR